MPEERQEFIVSWQKNAPTGYAASYSLVPVPRAQSAQTGLQCGYLESTFLNRTDVLGKRSEVSEKFKCDVNRLSEGILNAT